MSNHILWFEQIGMNDVGIVGGKNASLGEMLNQLSKVNIRVPRGFATTAEAFQRFLENQDLAKKIYQRLSEVNVDDVTQLTQAGKQIREWILVAEFEPDFINEVRQAYEQLTKSYDHPISVAVRSSATAEDLPDASFAGQQETYLNITGFDNLIIAIKRVFASLFNDRAIAYRVHHGFDHHDVALSAGIQKMARSDLGASGVMFTIDPESGFNEVICINAAYGLGEPIVQGQINPDEFYVYKPSVINDHDAILRRVIGSKALKMIYTNHGHESVTTVDVPEPERRVFSITDADIMELARYAISIEKHYGRPMDIEWAKDGIDGHIYIVQARPETVKSRATQEIERYKLLEKGRVIATGRSVGQKIGQGTARILKHIHEMDKLQKGEVLVTDMTDPDWEPVMKRASAIVTNRGGRTCHAAIIARELGIPAIVGCGDATKVVADGSPVTISCAEGDTGFIYDGLLKFELNRASLNAMPKIPFKIMLNVGNPERAFAFQGLPNDGVGLARIEFVINQMIGIHPQALLNFDQLSQPLKKTIQEKIAAYASPVEYYVERLKEGIATIGASFNPKMVIVRLSDFKSNEYANLLGGEIYEPKEENPMIGFRGASRYVSKEFRDCLALECEAVKRARDQMGLTNVAIMIPFVRTVAEAKQTIELLENHGLKRGENGLKIIMMCELPSNALMAEEFLEYFDGFSIGSNDMTQLTLGLDRDSGIIAHLFDERNPAVKKLLHLAIQACKKSNKYIGICGQGPSDHPDFAKWLVEEGIDSVSLNPDTVVDTWLFLAKK